MELKERDYYYDNGMKYEFDREACKKAIEHYIKINNKRVSGFDDDVCFHFENNISHRKISDIRTYCFNEKWPGNGQRIATDSTMIFYFKKLGEFFGNEMLFLKPVYARTGTIVEQLKYFYSQFSDILYHLSDSEYYNNIPSTSEFGKPFYLNKLKEIKKEADIVFLENEDIYNKIIILANEVEQAIVQFEVPGVSERWLKINPKLDFFDCVYDIIENHYDTYLKIREDKTKVSFRFYPTDKQILERRTYFEKNKMFPEIILYEREVCQAFRDIYNQDFKKYLQENEC